MDAGECMHHCIIAKSNATDRTELTDHSLVHIQETREVIDMINREVEQDNPLSQLSIKLLSSIIKAIMGNNGVRTRHDVMDSNITSILLL
jgi:hypothetical protein